MDLQYIIYDKSEGIATITLNRPEKLNAFNNQMLSEWAWAIKDADADKDVRCIVVTGAGRGFCSGMDVGDEAGGRGVLRSQTSIAERRHTLRNTVHHVPRSLMQLEKPYIAAVNGAAVGAGMDMASMADIRFASTRAKFGMAYVKMGLIPGDGGAYFLPRLVGLAKALELMWTGDIFTAEEAEKMGYVTRVCEPDQLMEETREFARRIAQGPAVSIQLIKKLAYRSLQTDLDHALDMAQWAMTIAQSTEDAAEGPRAFVENRKPEFKGR